MYIVVDLHSLDAHDRFAGVILPGIVFGVAKCFGYILTILLNNTLDLSLQKRIQLAPQIANAQICHRHWSKFRDGAAMATLPLLN